INRPEVFDLRPGSSFVEFLLGEGYDVFLVDWGVPDEEDAELGLAEFVCDEFDADLIADSYPAIPGSGIDLANKLMKPVANYATSYRRLFEGILDGKDPRVAYQAMAKWVADNPPFPSRAYREWITWIYKENRLVDGRVRLRDERIDLGRIEQNLLVVTAGADHIAPPEGTVPILDLVSSEDVTHFDRPGGHIGLMAGSKAKHQIWPELADWLRDRSDR